MSLETVVGDVGQKIEQAITDVKNEADKAAEVIHRAAPLIKDLQKQFKEGRVDKAYQALGTFSYQIAYFESQVQSIKNVINGLHIEENARVAADISNAPKAAV